MIVVNSDNQFQVKNSGDTYLSPDWPAPENVHCLSTTRLGGSSGNEFSSFNLAIHVQDEIENVRLNRARLQQHIGLQNTLQWIRQMHGSDVLRVDGDFADRGNSEADAIYTRQSNTACGVLTADCLPVFFCDRQGIEIAVAHAGWRGLSAGVLENTLACFSAKPSDVLAWMGPAIGPCHFEVGNEVKQCFLKSLSGSQDQLEAAFIPVESDARKWMADLYTLASDRLKAAGIRDVYGGGECTYCDEENYYSYRRNNTTGRMASIIWKA